MVVVVAMVKVVVVVVVEKDVTVVSGNDGIRPSGGSGNNDCDRGGDQWMMIGGTSKKA